MECRPTIAGVVLTLNEEVNLARALTSLSWCDQLIVIDSGSTDSTLSIARSYDATLLTNIQSPPFLITEQRNWALLQPELQSDWVLFLDADEQLSTKLMNRIQESILYPNGATAFYLCPRYWFLGRWLKHTQAYPNWHPRLIRRGFATFEGGVWEQFSADAVTSYIYMPYEHYSFSKGIDDWLLRHIRYADRESSLIADYLLSYNSRLFVTERLSDMRLFAARLWPLRPLLRFVQKYFLQLGFLEGWQSLVFCLMMSFYELIIVIKVIQALRARQGRPL